MVFERVSRRLSRRRDASAVARSVKLAKNGLEDLLGEQEAPASVRNSMQVQQALQQLTEAIEVMDRDSAEGVLAATKAFEELQSASKSAKEELEAKGDPEPPSSAALATGGRSLNVATVQFKPAPKHVVQTSAKRATGELVELTKCDLLYGETATIDGLWVFKDAIDPQALRKGLAEFLEEAPSFAGRIEPESGGIRISNKGVPLTLQYASGSYKDVAEDPSPREDWLDKRKLEQIWLGLEPIMTVCLTQLRDGGSVLGVVVSHGAAGGQGWFGTCMPRFAALVREAAGQDPVEKGLGSVVPVEDRSMLPKGTRTPEEVAQLVKTLRYKPLDFNDPLVGGLKRSMFYYSLKSAVGRPRVLVHYAPAELEAVKAAALAGCSRAKWLSTGEAVAAHIVRVMSKFCPSPALRPNHIACILDHMAFVGLPAGVVANTFYLYSCELERPADEMTLGEVADALHARIREVVGDKEGMLNEMRLQEDLIRCNYQPNPELKVSLPFVFNNQSKFKPLVQLDFGTGVAARYIPHAAGDSLLCVPARDGGMDIWLSTVNALVGDPTRLAGPDAQELLHEFCP